MGDFFFLQENVICLFHPVTQCLLGQVYRPFKILRLPCGITVLQDFVLQLWFHCVLPCSVSSFNWHRHPCFHCPKACGKLMQPCRLQWKLWRSTVFGWSYQKWVLAGCFYIRNDGNELSWDLPSKCSLVDKGSAGAGSVARLQIWNRNSTHWLVLLLEREGKDLTGVLQSSDASHCHLLLWIPQTVLPSH